MTWLSKVVFDARAKQVRNDFNDVEGLHRSVMAMFPDVVNREGLGVLFRVETSTSTPHLLVQSAVEPSLDPPQGYFRIGTKNMREQLSLITPGRNLRFRLLAAPFMSVAQPKPTDGGPRPRGTQVPVPFPEVPAWLARRFGSAGTPHSLTLTEQAVAVRSRSQRSLPSHAILIDGIISVEDPAALSQLVTTGVGKMKAFGCGMLSVAPV